MKVSLSETDIEISGFSWNKWRDNGEGSKTHEFIFRMKMNLVVSTQVWLPNSFFPGERANGLSWVGPLAYNTIFSHLHMNLLV